MKWPKISGETPQEDRKKIIKNFEESNNKNVIILSKVGDTSLDIPVANVILQVCFN